LERALNLVRDSLAKEIRLTEDVMSLLVEYHISPDLLSFAGHAETPRQQRIEQVKLYVGKMKEMIERWYAHVYFVELTKSNSKREELRDAQLRAQAMQPPPPPRRAILPRHPRTIYPASGSYDSLFKVVLVGESGNAVPLHCLLTARRRRQIANHDVFCRGSVRFGFTPHNWSRF
jgi:hypothetical protein